MKWTDEQVCYLKNNREKFKIEDLVADFNRVFNCNRSRKSIESKLFVLKIRAKTGKTGTRIYRTWYGMHRRCKNDKHKDFKYYGEKGICVCDDWAIFENFYIWGINNGYRDDLTIDRIDVNGNYCPENCRWITPMEQKNNMSSNKFITCFGETKTLAEWSRDSRCVVGYKTLAHRKRLSSFSEEEMITRKSRNDRS